MMVQAGRIGLPLLLTFIGAICVLASHGVAAPDAVTATEIALNKWLVQHPDYRLATDADCNCAEELALIRSPAEGVEAVPTYHPYFARGDFNRDGTIDAAYGVIKQGAPGKFSILIIDGARAARGRRAEVLLEEALPLGEALFFGPPANPAGGLMEGLFESEACSIVTRHFLGGYRFDCPVF
jgi:hypothetical protein